MRSMIEGPERLTQASNSRRSETTMTTSSQRAEHETERGPKEGASLAAAALMLTSAVLTFLVGVFALIANDLVVSGPGYEYTFQLSGWGWINLLTAVVLAAVAVSLFVNATGARAAAIVATCLAIVVSFLWMPYYPPGSIVLIALDVVVIWGVATWPATRVSA
jgi:hypothetical protein